MSYIIETRSPAPRDLAGDGWHSDGIGDRPIVCATEGEARDAIAVLRALGPDWAAAEYRYRTVEPRDVQAQMVPSDAR